MTTTLLRAGWIVTMDPKLGVLRNAGVLVENDRIAGAGRDLIAPPGSEVIDAPGAIVIPGLVNAHHHTDGLVPQHADARARRRRHRRVDRVGHPRGFFPWLAETGSQARAKTVLGDAASAQGSRAPDAA